MLNKVLLIGNLGKDVEMRFTPSGVAVANFSIATSETWKDKAGEKQTRTEWHRIVAFGRLAEIMGEYLHKGSRVFIEGKIQSRSWDKEDGTKGYSTEVVAANMIMLTPKNGGVETRYGEDAYGGAKGYSSPGPADTNTDTPSSLEDDDIPF